MIFSFLRGCSHLHLRFKLVKRLFRWRYHCIRTMLETWVIGQIWLYETRLYAVEFVIQSQVLDLMGHDLIVFFHLDCIRPLSHLLEWIDEFKVESFVEARALVHAVLILRLWGRLPSFFVRHLTRATIWRVHHSGVRIHAWVTIAESILFKDAYLWQLSLVISALICADNELRWKDCVSDTLSVTMCHTVCCWLQIWHF